VERPAGERKQAVLESFARYFGDAMLEPEFYVEKSWAADEWSAGCYTGFTPPGVLLDYGKALREPVGRIHWAGTETATRWSGYIDGAVQSGERAAAEVLDSL
jgi:monoamine oxidase